MPSDLRKRKSYWQAGGLYEKYLGIGGTRYPMELFTKFRGREPTIDALLHHSGTAV
jgi:oligopeptidase A